MDLTILTWIFVGGTFAIYFGYRHLRQGKYNQ